MHPTEFWCTDCGANSIWALADQLAAILGVSRRTVYRWLEKGRIHSRKLTLSGLRVFCACSVCGQRGRGSCDGCRMKIL